MVRQDEDIVQLLLQNGAKVDERILKEGVVKANETIFQVLLDYGADLVYRYTHERTILHLAAVRGSIGILSKLINKGVDIDARDAQGNTTLHLETAYNHEIVVQILFYAGG